MKTRWGRQGQSTAEYAIVIALVIGAVTAMQIYVSRSVKAKIKDGTDSVGAGTGIFHTSQYEPYYNQSDRTVGQEQHLTEDYREGTTTRVGDTTVTGGGTEATLGAEAMGSDSGWR